MTSGPGGDGLPHERTALAWQRTAITAVVALLPLLLVDVRLGARPLVVLGGLSTVLGVVLVGRTARRLRHLHGRRRRHDEPAGASSSPWPSMRAVALVATLAAAGAVATALTVALS